MKVQVAEEIQLMKTQQVEIVQWSNGSLQQHKMIAPVSKTASM